MPAQAPKALYRPWPGKERAAGRAGRAPRIEARSFQTSTRKPPVHLWPLLHMTAVLSAVLLYSHQLRWKV